MNQMKNSYPLDIKEQYINLLKNCVTHWLWISDEQKQKRVDGRDWPEKFQGETMIGMKRLENLIDCTKKVIEENITGDFIETGVWRGGAVIMMKGILQAYGVEDRQVWVADSFEGVPKPSPEKYPLDKKDNLYTYKELSVPEEEVIKNFKKYNLYDANVKILKGWFKDTLHKAQINKLAILRLDGDLYESTMDALKALYPKLSVGGYCIIDDYGTFPYCKAAVDDYRNKLNITEEIINIDDWGVYWRKTV